MQIENPYTQAGDWYKGQIHCHTTMSDGGMTPDEVCKFYYDRDYKFVCLTDHGVVAYPDKLPGAGFITIAGEEMSNPHMLAVGIGGLIYDKVSFERQISETNIQGGLAIVAHPAWMGLTVEEIAEKEGLCGIEAYNFICQALNGKGQSLNIWDELLMRGKKLWGFAVDDSHLNDSYPVGDQAWLMVRAPKLDDRALVSAMRRGNFYGTQGPEIHDIAVKGEEITVRCSPADQIRFIGAAYHGQCVFAQLENQQLTEATYTPAKDSIYCRIEVMDENQRVAWSNPLYVRG
jgi:hypothetical protein